MRILIVDDEDNITMGIKSILSAQENMKCEIQSAENGREALIIAKTFLPNLVITDIKMHYMHGLDLIKKLQEENICDKFIIISGYNKFEYAQTALRHHVLDYLLKPIDKQQLLHIVQQVWEELPENYALSHFQLPEIPYFSLNLQDETYPSSVLKVIEYIQEKYMC